MATTQINNYITKRYNNWLDAAKFRCSQAGIPDEAKDVLNEVLISVLKRGDDFVQALIDAPAYVKKQLVTELDQYMLKAILLNASSPTSPYQNKYKPIPRDENICFDHFDIEDQNEEGVDRSGYILDRMHEIRETIEELGFSERAMAIFEYRFFQDGIFKEFDGDLNIKELYDLYARIINVVRKKINGELLF